MRISDMIAYLGKDRQDAQKVGVISGGEIFSADRIGRDNAEIINNMTVNIIEKSYGKDYICMDPEYYEALSLAKSENYQQIYRNPQVDSLYEKNVKPMFEAVYEELLGQAQRQDEDSILYRHHMNYPPGNKRWQEGYDYKNEEPDQIVVDYISSMTDDYFIALYHELFPEGAYDVQYIGYFDQG